MNYNTILIITYARSGSTLLQGIMNSVDRVYVRGENGKFTFHLFRSYLALKNTRVLEKRKKPLPSTSPHYGIDELDEEVYLDGLKSYLEKFFARGPKNDQDIECYGFKEIHYADLPEKVLAEYLGFLERLFTNVCFIGNFRDPQQVCQSAFMRKKNPWKLKRKLRNFHSNLAAIADKRENLFLINYTDVIGKTERLEALFDFLGVEYSEGKVDAVLKVPHSYPPEPLSWYEKWPFIHLRIHRLFKNHV